MLSQQPSTTVQGAQTQAEPCNNKGRRSYKPCPSNPEGDPLKCQEWIFCSASKCKACGTLTERGAETAKRAAERQAFQAAAKEKERKEREARKAAQEAVRAAREAVRAARTSVGLPRTYKPCPSNPDLCPSKCQEWVPPAALKCKACGTLTERGEVSAFIKRHPIVSIRAWTVHIPESRARKRTRL